MNANYVNIGREEASLSIANINLLIRFNKTQENFFPSAARVLSIFLTTIASSASVEGATSKKRVLKVLGSSLAASYVHW